MLKPTSTAQNRKNRPKTKVIQQIQSNKRTKQTKVKTESKHPRLKELALREAPQKAPDSAAQSAFRCARLAHGMAPRSVDEWVGRRRDGFS